MQVTQSTSGYEAAWSRYRRWHLASFALLLAYVPSVALVVALSPGFLDHNVDVVAAFVVYAGSWLATYRVARGLRCPRCGELFFGSLWLPELPLSLVNKCRNCGLPEYAHDGPGHGDGRHERR